MADVQTVTSPHTVLKEQLIQACRTNLDILATLVLRDVAKYNFPEFYQVLHSYLINIDRQTKDVFQTSIALPRGFVKTTFAKIQIIHAIYFSKRSYFVLCAASESLAIDILRDVYDSLLSPDLSNLFGKPANLTNDEKSDKRFTIADKQIILLARGQGQAVRGLNSGFKRPDYIYCDDIQTLEDSESNREFNALKQWFFSTLVNIVSPEGADIVVSGNRYPINSFIDLLLKHPDWKSFSTGAILSDGTSLWEELHPIATIRKQYKSAEHLGQEHLNIFLAEKQNEPSAFSKTRYDLAAVRPIKFDLNSPKAHSGSFITIDPSGRKANSDKTAIGYYERYLPTELSKPPVLVKRKMVWEQLDPEATIARTMELVYEFGCPDIFVEAVGYQESLIFWFEKVFKELGITPDTLQVHPTYPQGYTKNQKAFTAFSAYCSQQLLLTEGSVFNLTMLQANSFNPAKIDNQDDILDTDFYAVDLLNRHSDKIRTVWQMPTVDKNVCVLPEAQTNLI